MTDPQNAELVRVAKQLHDALETLPKDDCADHPEIMPCQICAALDAYRRLGAGRA